MRISDLAHGGKIPPRDSKRAAHLPLGFINHAPTLLHALRNPIRDFESPEQKKMPTYKIRGIDVDFPFEAYDCQLVYMEKVIEALQTSCNALLESPTGTGKTLCLLCATLAWRKSLGAFTNGRGERGTQLPGSPSDVVTSQSSTNLPKIVYTSRTHSQLRQVIKELRRSNYRPKMVVLGSREQLCIHDQVSLLHGKAQTNACHFLCRKRRKRHCEHFTRVNEYTSSNPHLGEDPIDIEDLVNIGKKLGPCPYYLSRELHKNVDILFAPYNYLIDRGNRRSLKLEWGNSILIFDEAHNLESLCADAASFDLPSGLLTACISEAKTCIDLAVARREKSNEKSSNPDNFAILRALLLKLEKHIGEVPIESKEMGFSKPGHYIYEFLAELNITWETAPKLVDIMEEAIVLIEEDKEPQAKGGGCRLETISDILKIVFRDKGNGHADYYRVHVQETEANAIDVLKGKKCRTLSWWCFNPGIAMQEFVKLGVGSIILTSGTLSPMDSFAQELKLDFPIRLENPHVISSNQIWAGVVPVGPSGCAFNSSYRNRDSIDYKQELGNAIVNFARLVPDGVLVFFPSYYLLDQCIGCWKNTSVWERICKHKKPVVEPRQSSLFSLAIEDYMAKLQDTSTSGAIFFAVCRGKVSEGLDFADHAGRAVIVTGMPFATRNDPKVRLKREFLDEQVISTKEEFKMLKLLTGEDWYNQQASRAVNQAVGRVIRHRDDYGAIVFCDERFAYSNRQSQISLWIQPHLKCYSKFGDVVFSMTRFFRDGGLRTPASCMPITEKDIGSGEGRKSTPLARSITEDFAPSYTPIDQVSITKSFSSPLEGQKRSSSSQFEGILPANRSFLNSCVSGALKSGQSSDTVVNHKYNFIPQRTSRPNQNHETVDLTDDSSLDIKPSREQFLMPYPSKKRKVNNIECKAGQCDKSSCNHASDSQLSESSSLPFLVDTAKNDNLQISDARSTLNAKTHVVHKDTRDTACGDEAKGSAFLIQVKDKLNAAEYKEFVGFMRALKSKAMQIGSVLQSIVKLFSGPERCCLLERFRDYVPAKYRSLYEQCLESNKEMLGTPKR